MGQTITVDIQVMPGFKYTAKSNQSIGTEGCATCVGIIAILNDNTVFCGHIDSELEATKYNQKLRDQVSKATQQLLQNQSLNFNKIKNIYCVSGSMSLPTQTEIVNGIKNLCANKVETKEIDGIYWDGKEIKYLGGSDHLKGSQIINKENYPQNGGLTVK